MSDPLKPTTANQIRQVLHCLNLRDLLGPAGCEGYGLFLLDRANRQRRKFFKAVMVISVQVSMNEVSLG